MAEPIAQPASGANLLTQLLGQQGTTSGSTNTLAQQLQNILTQGSTAGTTSGTSSATTTNTAELAPLIAAFTQAQQGMSPEQLSALITSIFTEGAQQVPALTQQFANSTGSRVSGNSGLNLALTDLNKNLSSQAVQALLGYNQNSQNTAAQIAANIAANTRQTQQTGQQQQQTANTTQQTQQQTGTTNTNQTTQQQQRQGVNPNAAALVGAGGTALNWLDKKGVFDGIFGRNSGVGGIGTSTLPASSTSMPTLTNGGGASAGTLSAPAPSQGFLASAPVAAPAVSPYGNTSSIGAPAGGGTMAPIVAPNAGGITSLGGYSTPGGGLGTGFDMGFGSLPTSFNAFGTLGTESLGSNLDFGSNPYDYGGSANGITGVMGGGGGNFFGDLGGALGGVGDSLGGLLGGAADWIGSFFANGGMIGPQPRLAYADGGQVTTGAVQPRVRNANYMGPRMERDRTDALNYEGYAAPVAVGSSQPAGGSPSLAAVVAPAPAAPSFAAQSTGDPRQQALDLFREGVARQQAAAAAQAAAYAAEGGGGGNAEGSSQNEADNAAQGIGPSGIAAAPQGTAQGVSTAAGLIGMPAPGLSAMLGFIAAMAAAVNAANQPNQAMMSSQDSAGTGGVGDAATGIGSAPADDSPDIGVTVSVPGLDGISSNMGGGGDGGVGGVGASGGPGSGTDGGPGDSGVGGDSAGDGTSGSAGTSAGGDGWKNGGLVRGPGTGTSDSIPVKSKAAGGKSINYSDGEYVIPADVVSTLGTDLFDRLVAAHHTPVR